VRKLSDFEFWSSETFLLVTVNVLVVKFNSVQLNSIQSFINVQTQQVVQPGLTPNLEIV
jgi:hypothetical protein